MTLSTSNKDFVHSLLEELRAISGAPVGGVESARERLEEIRHSPLGKVPLMSDILDELDILLDSEADATVEPSTEDI